MNADQQLPLGLDGDDHTERFGDGSLPPDQAERDRIATDLESTLFVEAGAGSGKTRALVERIVALVEAGTPLENIAAITFTEKAANELRTRLRDALTDRIDADPEAHRIRTALAELDSAAISTLHSFAQRLLFEHPIEAGLPPGVEVLDELESQIDFDERWDDFFPELLNDPDHATALLVADVLGIQPDELRSLALQLEQNWDLAIERPPSADALDQIDLAGFEEAVSSLGPLLVHCVDHSDRMAQRIAEVFDHRDELLAISRSAELGPVDRIVDLIELLSATEPAFMTKSGTPYVSLGSQRNWDEPEALDEAKAALHRAGVARQAIVDAVAAQVINRLGAALTHFVAASVDQRREQGRLRFHDLLVMARGMLRHPDHGAAVRAVLRDRYRRLLIDEFQDTDPIQVDLATLVAAAADADVDRPWDEVAVTRGRLFFVGDPKQSIYRFRRADIGVYLRAQATFGGRHDVVRLSTNFRSTQPIIEWVNHVFGRLIRPAEDSQPEYVPLVSHRGEPSSGPGVLVVGTEPHPDDHRADDIRRAEAADVVRAITTATTEGWTVAERSEDGLEHARRARLGDITILIPSRTSLAALERALDEAAIPYRAETASLVYSSAEVRTLLLVARAIDDPTDELAVVAALRSSAFGCGDDDLVHYRRVLRGSWNHQSPGHGLPDDDPVVTALAWLADRHNERAWTSPSRMLDVIVRDRRLLELGIVAGRHREIWRRLRFVADQARAWSDSRGGTLREYLGWVRMQASDSSRVAETVLPESDADAVRIMTVHAAKGLEFPIVIASGLSTRLSGPRRGVGIVWPREGPPGIRMKSNRATPEYEAFQPIDEQLDAHERLRLLYVACTRARDHLVVSLHRKQGGGSTLADDLAEAEAASRARALPPGETEPLPAGAESPRPTPIPRAEWQRLRSAALDQGTRSRTVSATALARAAHARRDDAALDKEPRNLDLPPWQKGRYGTAVGRAVHAVLQTVDLADGSGLDQAAAAQAAAEGVLGRERAIRALASSALASEVVQEAARTRHWRELFVAAPVGDRLLEGYVDLAFSRADGLVIVDYKTDAWADDEDLDAKVDRYRVQTAAYARALESATGLGVVEAILMFLSEEEAVERQVPDLREAIGDIDTLVDLVRSGGEATTVED